MIYFLATNPAVLARLRGEVLTKVGESARPTYDDIREMKYLRAVINGALNYGNSNIRGIINCATETLRLFPPV